jgi:hypothetical protein
MGFWRWIIDGVKDADWEVDKPALYTYFGCSVFAFSLSTLIVSSQFLLLFGVGVGFLIMLYGFYRIDN